MATPLQSRSARSWSSVRLRGLRARARALEWLAMTGAREVLRTSAKVSSETCETSIIMPSRFISAMTSRPKDVRPWCRGGVAGGVGPVIRIRPGEGHVTKHRGCGRHAGARWSFWMACPPSRPSRTANLWSAWALRMSSGVRARVRVIGVAPDLLEDGVSQGEGAVGGGVRRVLVRVDPDGEELGGEGCRHARIRD